jgi:hypothetical protein
LPARPGHELDDWLQAEREIKHHLSLEEQAPPLTKPLKTIAK